MPYPQVMPKACTEAWLAYKVDFRCHLQVSLSAFCREKSKNAGWGAQYTGCFCYLRAAVSWGTKPLSLKVFLCKRERTIQLNSEEPRIK